MKNSIAFCLLFCLLLPIEAQHYYVEDSSLLVVELESIDYTGWNSNFASLGAHELEYLYGTTNYYANPGNFLLSYQIRIKHPGTYRFIWHSKVGKGSDPTEHNDDWLSIPDASDFYGYKNGHVVHPHGICTSDCPNGAGSGGWFKVYSSGTTNWTWSTRTSDNDPHHIYARFDTAGIYTIQISARSAYHYLNRFVLYNESVYTESQATNLWLKESAIYPFKVNQPILFVGSEVDTILISEIHSEIDSIRLVDYDSLLLDTIHVNKINADNTCYLNVKPQKGVSGKGFFELEVYHAAGEPFRQVYEFDLIKYINSAPVIDQVEDLELLLEEGASHQLTLTGLHDGNDGTQELTISSSQVYSPVITNPKLTYIQGADTANLQFQMKGAGEVVIGVTVQDDGGTDLGGSNSMVMRFKVTVAASTDLLHHDTGPEQISIYPNPVAQHLHVVSGADMPEDYEIYDFSGKKFQAGKFPGNATLDVSGLAKGAYILKCYSGKKMLKALQFFKY